jgi:hypothetical protein
MSWLKESLGGVPGGQREPASKIIGLTTWLTNAEAQQASADIGAVPLLLPERAEMQHRNRVKLALLPRSFTPAWSRPPAR